MRGFARRHNGSAEEARLQQAQQPAESAQHFPPYNDHEVP